MWFKKAAEQNDARAFWNLGKCYLDGEGTEKDEAKAIEYYQKSASAGDMYGQAELALAYQFGQGGLKEDPKKAFELYQLSATQGLASAQSLLAYCYENGVGTKKMRRKLLNITCYLQNKVMIQPNTVWHYAIGMVREQREISTNYAIGQD